MQHTPTEIKRKMAHVRAGDTMAYTIEAILMNGRSVTVQGLRDTDNIAACAARCQASGQFCSIWIYAYIGGRRVRGLRYDTGFAI